MVHDFAGRASSTRADALAGSLPDVLQQAQGGLPCREMCEAAVRACDGGCGAAGAAPHQETLGSLMTYIGNTPQLAGRARLLLMNGRVLFKKVGLDALQQH